MITVWDSAHVPVKTMFFDDENDPVHSMAMEGRALLCLKGTDLLVWDWTKRANGPVDAMSGFEAGSSITLIPDRGGKGHHAVVITQSQMIAVLHLDITTLGLKNQTFKPLFSELQPAPTGFFKSVSGEDDTIVTVTRNGDVLHYDSCGKILQYLSRYHAPKVTGFTPLPNFCYAVGNDRGELAVFDNTFRLVRSIKLADPIEAIFHDTIVTGTGRVQKFDGTLKYDVGAGASTVSIADDGLRAYCRRGKLLLGAGSGDSKQLGTSIKDIRCPAISNDSKWVACGTGSGMMSVFDTATGGVVLTQERPSSVVHVAVTTTLVGFSTEDNTVLLFSLPEGELQSKHRLHPADANINGFFLTSRLLFPEDPEDQPCAVDEGYSLGSDGSVVRYPDGKLTVMEPTHSISAGVPIPTKQDQSWARQAKSWMIYSTKGFLKYVNLTTFNVRHTIPIPTEAPQQVPLVTAMKVTSNREVVCGMSSGDLMVYSELSGSWAGIVAHPSSVITLEIIPQSNDIITGDGNHLYTWRYSPTQASDFNLRSQSHIPQFTRDVQDYLLLVKGIENPRERIDLFMKAAGMWLTELDRDRYLAELEMSQLDGPTNEVKHREPLVGESDAGSRDARDDDEREAELQSWMWMSRACHDPTPVTLEDLEEAFIEVIESSRAIGDTSSATHVDLPSFRTFLQEHGESIPTAEFEVLWRTLQGPKRFDAKGFVQDVLRLSIVHP